MSPIPARPDPGDEAWHSFVARFLGVFVGFLAVALAFVILVDPYDSGRFPSLGIAGVSDTNQRTENVSLGRSDKFDAAVFGAFHNLFDHSDSSLCDCSVSVSVSVSLAGVSG